MFDESVLRHLFHEAVRRSGTIGAQLSLIKGGEQLDLAVGFADAERRVSMTTDTVMQIGSVTKVFNATVVMSLAEEGLLDLDTPVREYLPGFKVADPQATGRSRCGTCCRCAPASTTDAMSTSAPTRVL